MCNPAGGGEEETNSISTSCNNQPACHPSSSSLTSPYTRIKQNYESGSQLTFEYMLVLWAGSQALESNLSRAPVFKTAVTGVKETLMRGTILCLCSSMYTNSSSFFAVYKNPNSFWNDLVMSKSQCLGNHHNEI